MAGSIELRFNSPHCINSKDVEEIALLTTAIRVSETYLNTECTHRILKRDFKIKFEEFARKLKDVTVRHANENDPDAKDRVEKVIGDSEPGHEDDESVDNEDDESVDNEEDEPVDKKAKIEQLEEESDTNDHRAANIQPTKPSDKQNEPIKALDIKDDKTPEAHSWILGYEAHRIFVNSIYLDRYRVADIKEKERISFMVGILLFHELGHLALQWGENDEAILRTVKLNTGEEIKFKMSPKSMEHEAGDHFELMALRCRFFTAVSRKALNREKTWNSSCRIMGVMIRKLRGTEELLTHDFIQVIINGSKESSFDPLKFKTRSAKATQALSAKFVPLKRVDSWAKKHEEDRNDEGWTKKLPSHCGTNRLWHRLHGIN